MATEAMGFGGNGLDRNRWRQSADAWILDPERAVVGLTIAGCAEIDAEFLYGQFRGLCSERCPNLHFGHVHERD